MGCDIHMHVEYKDRTGKWACGDYFSLDPDSTLENPRYDLQEFYGGRNYGLFSILADVRNYDNIEPIENPRGLPEDISEFVKRCYKHWVMVAHSFSYFTLQELIDFYKTSYDYDTDSGALKTIIDELKNERTNLILFIRSSGKVTTIWRIDSPIEFVLCSGSIIRIDVC